MATASIAMLSPAGKVAPFFGLVRAMVASVIPSSRRKIVAEAWAGLMSKSKQGARTRGSNGQFDTLATSVSIGSAMESCLASTRQVVDVAPAGMDTQAGRFG